MDCGRVMDDKSDRPVIHHPEFIMSHKPEFIPIPTVGRRCEYFSICRSTYYNLQKRGLIKFVQIRQPGNTRGRTLIRYSDMATLVQKLSEAPIEKEPGTP